MNELVNQLYDISTLIPDQKYRELMDTISKIDKKMKERNSISMGVDDDGSHWITGEMMDGCHHKCWYPNGVIACEEYDEREVAPQSVSKRDYYDNGQLRFESYKVDYDNPTKQLLRKEWDKEGRLVQTGFLKPRVDAECEWIDHPITTESTDSIN